MAGHSWIWPTSWQTGCKLATAGSRLGQLERPHSVTLLFHQPHPQPLLATTNQDGGIIPLASFSFPSVCMLMQHKWQCIEVIREFVANFLNHSPFISRDHVPWATTSITNTQLWNGCCPWLLRLALISAMALT